MVNYLKILNLLFLLILCYTTNAQKKQHLISYYQVYGDFLGNPAVTHQNNSVGVGQWGVGGNVNTGKQRVQGVVEFNYRKINLKELNIPGVKEIFYSEFLFGLRYFPMRPTFMIGNMAVRLNAGVLVGFDFEPNWRTLFSAGMALSPVLDFTGVNINIVYRPETLPVKGYVLEPSWALRAGFFIGPSNNAGGE